MYMLPVLCTIGMGILTVTGYLKVEAAISPETLITIC
jgi:hypothetical protein